MDASGFSFSPFSFFSSSNTSHKEIEPFDFFKEKNEMDQMDLKNPNPGHEEEEDAINVSLHIGPPNCTNVSLDSSDQCSKAANLAAATQYWIPTPEQILVGFTHFSCHICQKTFNRYNNLQVQLFVTFIFARFKVMEFVQHGIV